MPRRATEHDVRRLADVRAPGCVTIYGRVEDWARGAGATTAAHEQIRTAVRDLENDAAAPEVVDAVRALLLAQADGLGGGPELQGARGIALFATDLAVESFALSTAPSPWAGAGDRFLIAPLLAAALAEQPPVLVLALSEREVRLIELGPHGAAEVPVPGMPRGLAEAIPLDLTGDRNALARLRVAEHPKERLRDYCRQVAEVVDPVARARESLVIVAAAEPLASIYRSASDHPMLADEAIRGNHDGDPPAELADLARPVAARERAAGTRDQLHRFDAMPSRGLAVTETSPVLEACRQGVVDTLLVDVDHRLPMPSETSWGRSTIDIVDEAVRAALVTGAVVVPLDASELPTEDPMAAILRYPIPGGATGAATPP